MSKKELLLQRGFSEHDIDTNFAEYSGEWNIKTITLKQVAASTNTRQLAPLFYMDSLNYTFATTHYGFVFRKFAEPASPCEASPSQLDPYIARLCNAVNSIGIKTCMSCDGWHKEKLRYSSQMELYMKDRYSVLWFWLIAEFIFGEYWQNSRPLEYNWVGQWEPFDYEDMGILQDPRDMMICRYPVDNAKQIFYKQDCYAKFIEKHKNEFLELREHIIKEILERTENNEIEPIDTVGFLQARRYMLDIFLPLSEPLKDAFIREYGSIYRENQRKKK